MTELPAEFIALQQRFAERNEAEADPEFYDRVSTVRIDGIYHLDFYGSSFEENYTDLLKTLGQPELAPMIRSINLRGPDEGANGTHAWDLQPLLQSEVEFSALQTFSVQLNQPGDHNRSIIGEEHEEAGVLAKLLRKSPMLRELTVPSAPNAEFFEIDFGSMCSLCVDAGYDTQDFIVNLARSNCFPELRHLQWGEYNETYMDDFAENCTPFTDYQTLLSSPAFKQVVGMTLRNPMMTREELQDLKRLKPELQLQIIRFSDEYL